MYQCTCNTEWQFGSDSCKNVTIKGGGGGMEGEKKGDRVRGGEGEGGRKGGWGEGKREREGGYP